MEFRASELGTRGRGGLWGLRTREEEETDGSKRRRGGGGEVTCHSVVQRTIRIKDVSSSVHCVERNATLNL